MSMEWEEWEPIYEEILDDMGYPREADEAASRLLRQLVLRKDVMDADDLQELIGEEVTVYGFGNDLEAGLSSFKPRGTVIVADSATAIVVQHGIRPDIIVTDLDGDIEAEVEANAAGAIAVIHAHGDNTEALQRHVPSFIGPIIPTTQSRPDFYMNDFGGFTDGDRAVCLARHFGARTIHLVGFDLDPPRMKDGDATKARKLIWARKIIYEIDPKGVEIVRH
jgi:uncharacterized Rossmann fold enzyme